MKVNKNSTNYYLATKNTTNDTMYSVQEPHL